MKHVQDTIDYYQHGEHPRILFLSGMHGDEYQSAEILAMLLQKEHLVHVPFLYIPAVSPSAVKNGTRKNADGHDINRQFINEISDSEAKRIVDIVSLHSFTSVFDIHEDPDRTSEFYLYDSQRMSADVLNQYRRTIEHSGTKLFTGLDDPDDHDLGCHIDQGYYYFRNLKNTEGFFSKWALEKGIAKRIFTVEIPGKATRDKKQQILETILPFLIAL